jgi:RNA polymerase sigma-70 factor (ECF subfamily)
MSIEELERHIEGCRREESHSQRQIYQQFYGLGLHICLRYAQCREEAEEMCHDGFVRAFSAIKTLERPAAIKGWLTRIFVLSAIDHYRKYRRSQPVLDELELATGQLAEPFDAPLERLSYEEKLRLVQALPTSFRLAFNLCVVEGYAYSEAAAMLLISEAALRSNVTKARQKLREMIFEQKKTLVKATK